MSEASHFLSIKNHTCSITSSNSIAKMVIEYGIFFSYLIQNIYTYCNLPKPKLSKDISI